MTAKWGFCTIQVLCLTLCIVGCRTTRPDVVPPKSVERLVEPPPGALASGDYPSAAHDKMVDSARQAMDAKTGVIIPTRGAMGPGQGMSGRGGGR